MKKILSLLILSIMSSILMAGGLALSGVGTRAISMGGAMRGLADENTAVFWNPAGLAFLNESTFTLSAATINSFGEIKNSEGTKFENKEKMYAFPNLAYAPTAKGKFNYGIGLFVPFGLGSQWDTIKPLTEEAPAFQWDDDIKKWETKAEIAIIDIHPGFSYKISDKLAIGAGLSIMYGDIKLSKARSLHELNAYFLELDLEGTGWTMGANFGAMYKYNDKLTFGLSGKLPTSITVDGDAKIAIHQSNAATQGAPVTLRQKTGAEAEMNLPGDIGFGYSYKITDNWLVSADITYTFWNTLDKAPVKFDDPTAIGDSFDILMEWDDTIRFSVGGENKFNSFDIRYGYYFDPSPIPETTLGPTWPDINDKHSFNTGFGYYFKQFEVSYGFEYIHFTERVVDTANEGENFLGTYNAAVIAMNASLTYRF